MKGALIDSYANGSEKVKQAIRGLTREDLLAQPTDPAVGMWSIQQVVIHIADADAVLADWMKRVIAEENPSLLAFDEGKWMNALACEERSAADAAEGVQLTRSQIVTILKSLPDSAFERTGMHSQRGRMTLAEIVEFAADHLEHHLMFIHAKRAKMGKEMW